MKKNIIFALIIITISLICFVIISFFNNTGSEAVISIVNAQTITLPLNANKIYEFDTDTGSLLPFTIEVKDSSARFINSVCPDHVCETFGRISKEYEQATCAPGGVVLSVRE